ncbi:MAG TPA: sulfotransferase domain-containing protein [Planctomycetaceae bacterium]|jgi:hypothetical protein|nr:sulfotransferase domain-containing protein [Planctomycetaceae bacterium]
MTVTQSLPGLNPKTVGATATTKTCIPDFLILGAAKCGTTSLHGWLNQHPQIQMSFPKEPVYFELEYDRGPDFYRSTYFAGSDGRRLLGDARTANLFFPWVPARVKESNPEAKLIILLRNPIDRCLAQWWTEFRRDKEPLHFEEAVMANLERLRTGARYDSADAFWTDAPVYQLPRYTGERHRADYHRPYQKTADPTAIFRTYVDAGYYAEQIERYRRLFPEKQIRIFLAEDLRSNPGQVLRDVCELIGVRTEAIHDIDCRPQNVGKPMKRSKAIKYWLTQRLHGKSVAYADVRRRPAVRPQFRQFLADHFRPFNSDLSKLLNRDLSHWV